MSALQNRGKNLLQLVLHLLEYVAVQQLIQIIFSTCLVVRIVQYRLVVMVVHAMLHYIS